ncbi:hypothetical protein [Paraprevotella xylaniphila]|uniref:hypothetical protein n=1 Tax=Paraprevotella xylaniphila TaxID=454155 RepID=UPI003AB43E96
MRQWKSNLSATGRFPFLFARREGRTSVEKQKTRKYGVVLVRQSDMMFLTAERHQIEWKEAVAARVHPVFKCLFVLWADLFAATCGQKKCFFSRTKNFSHEIGAALCLTKVKNEVEW